ncbi:hypothetical protein [Corallococcus sp. 4LFB]|uniref:hypothetical protein n=1 Tax=Corallococcus sp. 4LFB TaxID=3383249 RepID=UPI003976B919
MEDHGADAEHRLTEERLALLSVLQELSVAALDLLDPDKPADDFLDRVAERLGCTVALWLQSDARGQVGLLGASGLSPASRQLPIPRLLPRHPGEPGPSGWSCPIRSWPGRGSCAGRCPSTSPGGAWNPP